MAAEVVEAKAAEAVEVELDIAPDPEPEPTKSLPPPLPSGPRLVPESSSAGSPPPESSPSSAAPIPLVQLRVATPQPEPSPLPVQRPPAQSIGRDMDAAFLREAANDSVAWESASFTDDDDEIADDPIAFKMTDEARMRRAHLAKYVKAVVAGCALVCVGAVVRLGVGTASEPPRATLSEVSPALPPVAAPANAALPSVTASVTPSVTLGATTPAPASQPIPAVKTMRAALRETKHPSPFRP